MTTIESATANNKRRMPALLLRISTAISECAVRRRLARMASCAKLRRGLTPLARGPCLRTPRSRARSPSRRGPRAGGRRIHGISAAPPARAGSGQSARRWCRRAPRAEGCLPSSQEPECSRAKHGHPPDLRGNLGHAGGPRVPGGLRGQYPARRAVRRAPGVDDLQGDHQRQPQPVLPDPFDRELERAIVAFRGQPQRDRVKDPLCVLGGQSSRS